MTRNENQHAAKDAERSFGLPRPLLPAMSLVVAFVTIAWTHLGTGLPLFWDGAAMSRVRSTVVSACIALCWHATILAAGGPKLFRDPVVFATAALLPLIVFALSSNWFFQPSTWTAQLALAMAAFVLMGGIAHAIVRRSSSKEELAATAARRLSRGVAAAYLAMSAATATFAPTELAVEGRADHGLDSQQAFEKIVAASPSSASQQEIADALAGFASAEAARLGVEKKPRVAIEFDPYAPYAARTEGGAISVNARYLSSDPSENSFYVAHEVFHLYQQEVAAGTIDPAATADAVARQLAEQHAEDWARELEGYSSIYGGRAEYEGQLLEKDADAYANITVNVLAGRISYST